MLFEPGVWFGNGAWRKVNEKSWIRLEALIIIREQELGVKVRIEIDTVIGPRLDIMLWIYPTETGLHTVSATGPGLKIKGTANLANLPHLALLQSDDGLCNLAVTMFELSDADSVRGLFRTGDSEYIFEIVLRPRHESIAADNIIKFDLGKRKQ